ncbi:hypothetical protein SALBM311S_01641 [Streptomyces alboniger]
MYDTAGTERVVRDLQDSCLAPRGMSRAHRLMSRAQRTLRHSVLSARTAAASMSGGSERVMPPVPARDVARWPPCPAARLTAVARRGAVPLPASKEPNMPLREQVSFAGDTAKLSGRLFLPDSAGADDSPPVSGVVVAGTWTSVKEQMADRYAEQLADRRRLVGDARRLRRHPAPDRQPPGPGRRRPHCLHRLLPGHASPHGAPLWTLGGDYRWELTHTGGRWLITTVVMTATWGDGNRTCPHRQPADRTYRLAARRGPVPPRHGSPLQAGLPVPPLASSLGCTPF